MTEQEVQAFAERLTQVWKPITPFTYRLYTEGTTPYMWFLNSKIAPNYGLEVFTRDTERRDLPFFRLNYLRGEEQEKNSILCTSCRSDSAVVTVHIYVVTDYQRRAVEQWVPVFRRNCWLSGIPIEASADEKVEWMQSFSSGEVEAYPSIQIPEYRPESDVPVVVVEGPLFMSEEQVKSEAQRFVVACGCQPDLPISVWIGINMADAQFCYDPHQEKFAGVTLNKDQSPSLHIFEAYHYLYADPSRDMAFPGTTLHEHPLAHDMARILFRLGYDPSYIEEHFGFISLQEQLELREQMPREFWLQKWIDEEADSE